MSTMTIPDPKPGVYTSEFLVINLVGALFMGLGVFLHRDLRHEATLVQAAVYGCWPALAGLYTLGRVLVKVRHVRALEALWAMHGAEVIRDIKTVEKAAAPLRKPRPAAASPPAKT